MVDALKHEYFPFGYLPKQFVPYKNLIIWDTGQREPLAAKLVNILNKQAPGGKIQMGRLEYIRKTGELYVADNRYSPVYGFPGKELALFKGGNTSLH